MKTIIVTILFLFSCQWALAQETADKKTDVETVVVAYVTQKLSLTADEANSFFPIFKNYMKEYRTAVKAKEGDEIGKNEAVVEVQKKFKPKFQEVLKSEKRANKAFNVHQQLMNRLKAAKENRQARAGRKGARV